MLFNSFTITLFILLQLTAIVLGYRIISGSDCRLVGIFRRRRIRTAGMGYFGSFILISVVFIFFPETFLAGAVMLALATVWLCYMRLAAKAYRSVFITCLYLLVIMAMAICGYPEWLGKSAKGSKVSSEATRRPVAVCGRATGS